MRIRKYQDYLR